MARRDTHLTGMHGVYLVAAELTAHGLIVSPTLRNAPGADLLVTTPDCQQAWSVQVKTNSDKWGFWLVGKKAMTAASPSHIYVLVNLIGRDSEFYIIPSKHLAPMVREEVNKNSTWYSVYAEDADPYRERWECFTPDTTHER